MADTAYPDYERGLTFEKVWAGFQELKEFQKEVSQQMKETDLKIKETSQQIKETGLEIKELAQQLKETEKIVKETSRQMGLLNNRITPREF